MIFLRLSFLGESPDWQAQADSKISFPYITHTCPACRWIDVEAQRVVTKPLFSAEKFILLQLLQISPLPPTNSVFSNCISWLPTTPAHCSRITVKNAK